MLISCNHPISKTNEVTFRINSTAGITSLDPAFARTQENIRYVNQLFNGLVALDSALNITPKIAKDWQVSNDGLVYTFILRNDVFFHNSPLLDTRKKQKVNAKDFKYSFERISNPKTASDGAWIFNKLVAQNGFKALNDSVLEITLIRPFTPFLSLLTMSYCSVVPQEVVEHYGDDFGKHPIGTGFFRFANWEENVKLNLIKNESYYDKDIARKMAIDILSVSFIESPQMALLAFFQGKLDAFTGLESSFKDALISNDGDLLPKHKEHISMIKSPFLNTEYIGFNIGDSSSPFFDNAIRAAISLAIDKENIVRFLRNNVGKSADGGFVPFGLPGYSPQDKNTNTKHKVKIDATKKYTIITTKEYLDVCILIQKNVRSIGIPLEIEVVPSSVLKTQKTEGKAAFFRGSWIADYPDAENFLACFTTDNLAPNGPNYFHFSDEKYDKLYETLLKTTDSDQKNSLISAMESKLSEAHVIIPLFYDQSLWFVQNGISNFKVNALNQVDFSSVKKATSRL